MMLGKHCVCVSSFSNGKQCSSEDETDHFSLIAVLQEVAISHFYVPHT